MTEKYEVTVMDCLFAPVSFTDKTNHSNTGKIQMALPENAAECMVQMILALNWTIILRPSHMKTHQISRKHNSDTGDQYFFFIPKAVWRSCQYQLCCLSFEVAVIKQMTNN